MAENYLITGYWGEPHVTAENDRGINAAIFGEGRFVLPVGEQFRAEYIGNNTIRMYDGKLLDNGNAAGIPAGSYVDLLIANAGQGKKRNDLIVFQYEQDSSTLIESGQFVIVQGTETSGTAQDPALTQQDLLTNAATFDQFALWRVPVSGTAISAPVKLFTVANTIPEMKKYIDDLENERVVSIKNGGTGASTPLAAADTLGFPSLLQATRLVAGTDLNTILTLGNYKCSLYSDANSMLNCPVRGEGFRLFVSYPVPGLPDYIAQEIFETGGGTRHYRLTKDSGETWSNWTTTYDSESTIPIENGGTGASNIKMARQNMFYLGTNPVASSEEDTPQAWAALGIGVFYITKSGYLIDQPATVGFCLNFVSGELVKQVWFTQSSTSATIYQRGGNANGWYPSSWVQVA